MKFSAVALAAFLPLFLAGCGVPDLIAHGVKSYEENQEKARQYDAQQQPAPQQAQPATYTPTRATKPVEPDPVTVQNVPPRESVTSEPLR